MDTDRDTDNTKMPADIRLYPRKYPDTDTKSVSVTRSARKSS